MRYRRLLLIACSALAGALHAQPALVMESPPLPVRNLLIEVRQDDGQSSSGERLGADINARVQPGRTEAQITLEAQSRRVERSGRAQQQALVLNGHATAIVLGNSTPLRLRQVVTRNGVRRLVPGTVWLEAGTGFTATPIWEGSDMVYLQLAATQGRQALMGNTASVTTTLMLPLDEWTTVAESDDAQEQQQGALGLGSGARERRSDGRQLRVQVRVSVR